MDKGKISVPETENVEMYDNRNFCLDRPRQKSGYRLYR